MTMFPTSPYIMITVARHGCNQERLYDSACGEPQYADDPLFLFSLGSVIYYTYLTAMRDFSHIWDAACNW